MRRLDVVTRFIFVLGFSVALTAAVYISSSLGAQLPAAAAAGATSLPAAPGDNYCVAVISTTYPGCTRVFTNVQAAVDAASGLETIKVSQGTYTDVSSRPIPDGYLGPGGNITQVVYLTKTVFIQGGYTTANWTTPDPAAHPTTLDAQSKGRVVLIAGEITPTLTGLRLTGGNATGLGGDALYGGADVGGGLFILSATATLSNSWVYSNTANDDPLLPLSEGGGLYLASGASTLYANTIATNTAQYGGGVALSLSEATVSRNSIFGNLANDGGWGGGLYIEASTVDLNHNAITTNSADTGSGGGLAAQYGTLTLSDNIIASNTITDVAGAGGGVYLNFTIAGFTNTVIVDNEAGLGDGVYVAPVSSVNFKHTTLANNTGGDGSGIYVESSSFTTVNLINTILVSHTVGVSADADATVDLNSTLFGGGTNTSGTGTIINTNVYGGNPGFANPSAGDYHLTSSSAALDVGIDAGVTTDLDGLTRPIGLGFDLGAYELYNPALSVSKGASGSALPGGVVTYTVRITNTGNVTLTTYLSDTLPTSVTFKGPVTVSPAGGSTGTPPALAGGQSLGLGKSVTVTFPVTLSTGTGMTAGAFITNTAAITSSPLTISAQPINASTSIIIQNAAPIAVNDVYTMSGNTSTSLNVRSNDSDPNGDALTITAVGSGVGINGIATINGGTTLVYTPTTDFVGTATFTYTVSDPGGLKSTASVQVNVLSVPISGLAAQNSSPTAFGSQTYFTATVTAGTAVTYTWNFGDGNTLVGKTVSHIYGAVGNYTVLVTATNAFPSSATANTSATITKATPVVAITSDTPDPSVVGQSVPIAFTVTPPGAFTPTGIVTVTDGTQSCSASVASGTCPIAFASVGVKSLTAHYGGDSNFNGATSSSEGHVVTQAGTTISITSIAPSPALFGQPTAITVSLTVNPPGAGTPTGVITVTDGTVTCHPTLSTPSSCNLTFNSLGTHTITATYSGDANFAGSNVTSPLTVNDVPIAGLAAQNSSPTRLDDATYFTATVTAGTNVTYVWNFGDGSPTANGSNVSHSYALSTTYTALVTATNSANSLFGNTPVTVTNQRPVAVGLNDAFSLNTTATLDGSGSYDPDHHTPLTYFWTQTGGVAVSFTPNLSVTTFTAPGAATVLTFSLTVTDTHGLASPPTQVVITIDDIPITGLTAHNASPTAFGVTTQFSATIATGSSVTYVWNFGDGNIGGGASTSHTYATPGNYVATVTATNALPSMASATTAVTITKATPVVAITSDTPDPSMVGQSVPIAFTVTPPGVGTPTGTVTVTDGTQSCSVSVAAGTCNIAFASPGSKTLTAQYGGDSFFNGVTSPSAAHLVNKADTLTSISPIVTNPTFFGQPTPITVSLTITSPGAGTPTGTINVTDGTVSCEASLPTPSSCSLTFNALGTHIITATYPGDANFNASSSSTSLMVNDVPIEGLSVQSSSPTRLDDATFFTATITAGTNASYVWDFGDGSPAANGANVSHSYASTGSYTATVTASNSANNPFANTTVVVTNQPPVAVALSDGVSPGTLATLDGSGSFDPDNHTPLEYFWTQTGGASVSFTPNLSVTTFTAPASSTVLTFTLTVTDAHGVPSAPSQAVITVADLAITNLTAASSSPTVLSNVTAFTATQTGGTGVSYVWDFGDGIGTGTGANPSYTYPSVGTYVATVTATNVVNQLTRTTQVIVGLPVSGLAAASNSPRFVGSSTTFTATITAGTNVAYQWTFGDGGTGSGANPTHTYTAPGSYTAMITATNVFGSQVATTTVASLAQAALSVVATDAPDPVSVGKALVYAVVVHNAGPTSADNVVVTDTLPTGVTFGSAVTTQGTCTTPTVTCNIGTLANGGTVTVTITATPSMSITSPVIVTNRAGVSSTTADPSLADNLATITTTIYPRRIFLPIMRR